MLKVELLLLMLFLLFEENEGKVGLAMDIPESAEKNDNIVEVRKSDPTTWNPTLF